MGAAKTLEELSDEFEQALTEYVRLRELNNLLEAMIEVAKHQTGQGTRPRRSPLDPFIVLERLVSGVLTALEPVVTRIVHRRVRARKGRGR
jgi:hypothetical protein